MIRKIPVTNPQHQTYTVKNASVCTEKKQQEPLIDGHLEVDNKMIVHVADVLFPTSLEQYKVIKVFPLS